ncbi:hypothetical protein EHYA_08814 [Embleya hyalina]|uniref:Uncharacterized protein n=1 Tax=Embleya hyalina TaxID=516124 RepID=A0A401Z2E0_9ACTN|nr:hypothetical protein EHYA_08814 [Embleya hyalina]
MDSSIVRAHPHAAGARKEGLRAGTSRVAWGGRLGDEAPSRGGRAGVAVVARGRAGVRTTGVRIRFASDGWGRRISVTCGFAGPAGRIRCRVPVSCAPAPSTPLPRPTRATYSTHPGSLPGQPDRTASPPTPLLAGFRRATRESRQNCRVPAVPNAGGGPPHVPDRPRTGIPQAKDQPSPHTPTGHRAPPGSVPARRRVAGRSASCSPPAHPPHPALRAVASFASPRRRSAVGRREVCRRRPVPRCRWPGP